MNPKQTYFLVTLALLLLGFIYFFERHQPGAEERKLPPRLFPNLEAREIEAMEVAYPASGATTRAEQMEGKWRLVQPAYPAQQTALDNLALTLEQLRRLEEIPAHELLVQGAKGFGFDPPRASLRVESGTNRYVLQLGATTPLTTNVYVKLENSGQVFVTDGRLLEMVPASTNAWRSPRLVELDEFEFNRIRLRSGNRLVELERNGTNDLWHISRPIPARADQGRVNGLLQALSGARATRFVADGVTAELEQYGLQSPVVEATLLESTNEVFRLEIGKAATNANGQVFVRRLPATNVVLADARIAGILSQPYKTFHDPRLLTFRPATLDRIKVDSVEDFTLQRQPDGSWMIIEPLRMKADEVLMSYFVTNLTELKILDLAKEVPTEQDLASLNILRPVASYTLFEQHRDPQGNLSNLVFTEIAFGTNRADTIFVKRSDETPVYLTLLSDMLVLPRHVFEVRDRQIWNFSATNVVSLTVRTQQQSRTMRPEPTGSWAEDPILAAAREETLYRLGQLEAMAWVAKGGGLERFGITGDSLSLQVAIEKEGGEVTHELHFGLSYRGGIYTAAVLPGDEVPTVFLFPGPLYEELLRYFPPQ